METMTVPSTEKQIDELSKRFDFGFEQTNRRLGRVEDDVRELRTEMNAGFRHVDDQFTLNRTETKGGFDQVKAEVDKVDGKFDRVSDEFTAVRAEMKAGFDGMQRLMTRFFAGTLGTIVAGVIASAILSHF